MIKNNKTVIFFYFFLRSLNIISNIVNEKYFNLSIEKKNMRREGVNA